MSVRLCRYYYDPLDRLAGHMATGEDGIRLLYQKSRLVAQVQGALQCSILQWDEQVLAQQQLSGKTITTTLLAADLQRSVLHSMDGESHEGLAYTAYGHLSMNSGLNSLLGFNSERRDPLTGHYLLGHGYRAFNPVLIRFNSPDALSPFGSGRLNAYAYCLGDPVNRHDPDGHMPLLRLLSWGSMASAVGTALGIAAPESDALKILAGATVALLAIGAGGLKLSTRAGAPSPPSYETAMASRIGRTATPGSSIIHPDHGLPSYEMATFFDPRRRGTQAGAGSVSSQASSIRETTL